MQTIYYKLTRETPKYNQAMKWHLTQYVDGKRCSSEWFRTKKAGEQSLERDILRGKKGFHIGGGVSYTQYSPLNGMDELIERIKP